MWALCHGASAQTTTPSPADYTVDAAQGPVTGSTRVIGLGGAFVAVAEDMDGIAVNPASVAVRLPYSWHRFDQGFGLNFAIGGWLPKTNFLNQNKSNNASGAEVEQRSLLFGSIGATLYYDYGGFGLSAEGQRQALRRSGDTNAGLAPTQLSGNFGIVHASVAYGFWDGQLVIGMGPRVTGVSLSRASSASDLLSVAGVGYQVGVVFKPMDHNLRFGAAFKPAVTPSLSSSGTSDRAYNTSAIRLPWQASAGFAYQFGRRPLNPRFFSAEDQTVSLRQMLDEREAAREAAEDEAKRAYERDSSRENERRLAQVKAHNEREEKADERLLEKRQKDAEDRLRRAYLARPRDYVLLTTELLALGASAGSVGFGSFYEGQSRVQLSGQNVTFSPRIGLESEVVPNWLKVRAGGYWEPARVSGATDRAHGTFGLDVRLFRWNVFGLIGDFDSWLASVAVDGARQYLSTSFSVGFWH